MMIMKNKLFKTVEIGGEEIEQAEYFCFDMDYLQSHTTKSEIPTKATLWDKITLPIYRFAHKVKNIYWNIRYGFQRMFKGYDNVDVFDTFSKFIDRYSKILVEYRKFHVGYVGTMTLEEWNSIIDEMIFHLYYMNEKNVNKELKKCVSDNWIPTLETVSKIMDSHKNKFFKLFSEYFYSLWD